MNASEADQLRTGTLTDFLGDFILPKRLTGEGHGMGRATPRVTQHGDGHPSIAMSSASTHVTSLADSEPSKFRLGEPAQEDLQREERGSPGHAAAHPPDSTLSNYKPNLNAGNVVGTIGQNKQILKWSCLVCTL
jgi:hypothetical protein